MSGRNEARGMPGPQKAAILMLALSRLLLVDQRMAV